jgi:RHS repeat-associated protein
MVPEGASETTSEADPNRAPREAEAIGSASQASVKAAPGVLAGGSGTATAVPGGARSSALPTGADKTGVSSQAISVPSGAGKIQGMGESFSAQLSTGIATFNVPISLPAARGAAQPSLALSYSSASGHGLAGVGWSIGVPFIARQTDRGIPKYDDPPAGGPWQPEQDRFVFNGGQELVPICLVGGTEAAPKCQGSLAEEQMPNWSVGWQYFRPRVEGSFQRFFWSTDHRTWRVQDKSGVTMELGVPYDDATDTNAIEVDPANAAHTYRWNLSREYDAHVEQSPPMGVKARPVNVVRFRYRNTAGEEAYLTDIWDTSPVSNPAAPLLTEYAHHTRLNYEERPDPAVSFRRGWRTSLTKRLAGIDVTSRTFEASGARHVVRRYHLGYDADFHVSLLTKVQVEGRCSGDETQAPAEGSDETLPDTDCARLPAMTFDYSHVLGFDTTGKSTIGDLPGHEAFDERVHTLANSPDHSVDEELTDLFDVNSDGLPDILVTAPGLFKGKHGVYFNGAGGKADSFGASTIGVQGLLGADANTITLKNLNLSAQDVDGDGTIDLVHMPMVKTYSVYAPKLVGKDWQWVGRAITSASAQNPRVDLGKDALDIRVMDVNADGLVDIVFSAGTEVQTFFALGRYPGGDGQFGHATRVTKDSAIISNDPVRMCVPWDSTPMRFSDPDIKLADMNGDGLADIVRIRRGDVRYWPGRGNGLWGTGKLDDCAGGTFGQARNIVMMESPQYSDIQGDSLRLDDVNGDGLDDLVQVRFDAVDVWLNVDGTSWTKRHTIAGTPPSPSYANRVRLVDINGSGTRDVLWGDGLKYRYIDLAGGKRPGILTYVANGFGKTTAIEYASSTDLMLAAEAAHRPWTSKAPMPLHVVTKTTERDNLDLVGRPAGKYVTEYSYADPMYDGRQREFRGFRHAEAKKIGDDNSPTSIASTDFLLGECKDEILSDGTRLCSSENRWRDHGHEALKGLPVLTETHDENRVYLSTAHETYRLRHLYDGLDGRAVRHAFASATDTWLYDTALGGQDDDPLAAAQAPKDVELEAPLGQRDTSGDESRDIALRGKSKRTHTLREMRVDAYGNVTDKIASGCTDCAVVDEVITTHAEPGRIAADPGGWLWRTLSAYVQGSKNGKSHEQRMTYNSLGDLTMTEGYLSGTLALDRSGVDEEGVSIVAANAPREASSESADWILVSGQQRDAYGNVERAWGPNGHCRSMSYDAKYQELATSESVYVGKLPDVNPDDKNAGRCGPNALKAEVKAYDRGLALPLDIVDLHGEPTHADYDAFGRVSAMTKPSPYLDEEGKAALSGQPSVKVEYRLPGDWATQPYAVLHTVTADGADHDVAEYQESWDYVDGLGRTVLTLMEADPEAGDGGHWIVSGLTDYDAKGAKRRAYLPWFWDGSDPGQYPVRDAAPSAHGRQRYDAFGRQLETYNLDGSVSLRNVYHALGVDKWDAADLEPGPHQGTYASAQSDGHGRMRVVSERAHAGNVIEERQTITEYEPAGEVTSIRRHRVGKSEDVVRWMHYDSLGRMVLNAEPHTTKNFQPAFDVATVGDMRAWRYAYNDAGDLVGTSDARGCGANYLYDAGGRLLGEDYSPCEEGQEAYSEVDSSTGAGLEVTYHYDDYAEPVDDFLPPSVEFPIPSKLGAGRLTWVADRASKTVTRYDGRGRVTGVARQVAKPTVAAGAGLGERYAATWYKRKANFDGADRPVRESTGARVAELLGKANDELHEGTARHMQATDNKSVVVTEYTQRGAVKSVRGSYDALVGHVYRDADGLVTELQYGDLAHTTTSSSYDTRRRLRSVQTYRGPPEEWKSASSYSPSPTYGVGGSTAFQLLLQDEDFSYDAVDNPTEIHDWRLASEWPEGAKPVSKKIQYDDLYRVSQVDYTYPGGSDAWVSPFDAEDRAGSEGARDPRRAKPSPHVAFDKRVQRQTFQYDWLGNTSKTTDDASGFYDRSLGTITGNATAGKPYQLAHASNQGSSGGRTGSLDASYDDAGNLTSLTVRRAGPCLPTAASCRQRYGYRWDEVGRLVEAKRWELDDAGNATGDPSAQLSYAYDSDDVRVIKTAAAAAGASSGDALARSTLYVFASLELRRAQATADGGDYDREAMTEVPYLDADGVRLARVVAFQPVDDVPAFGGTKTRVFLELDDHLGSTSVVLDQRTGELVERGTYEPHGAAESDYRTARWKEFREDYRFTGKEEDIEVGLQYFGKRFLSPYLGRWASADPLAVHVPGRADLNAYAYVHGMVLIAVDPVGLDEEHPVWAVVAELTHDGICDWLGCGDANATVSRIDVPYNGTRVSYGATALKVAAGAGLGVVLQKVAPRVAKGLIDRAVESAFVKRLGKVAAEELGRITNVIGRAAAGRLASFTASMLRVRSEMFQLMTMWAKESAYKPAAREAYQNVANALEHSIRPEEIVGAVSQRVEGVAGHAAPRWAGTGKIIDHVTELRGALNTFDDAIRQMQGRLRYLEDQAYILKGWTEGMINEKDAMEGTVNALKNLRANINGEINAAAATVGR